MKIRKLIPKWFNLFFSAKPHKIKVKWIESQQPMDINYDELSNFISDNMAKEIDNEILKKLVEKKEKE